MVDAKKPLRVISLLPSATENFSALLEFCGAQRALRPSPPATSPLPVLVGRSHECDFPATEPVQSLPVLTAARTAFTSSADTHNQVRQALAEASSLYHLDAAKLVALTPDVILTQSSCKVCSIDLATVESSLAPSSAPSSCSDDTSVPLLSGKTARIVTCNPTSLVQVLGSQFEQLGRELGVEEEGKAMAQAHLAKLQELQHKAQAAAVADGEARAPRVLMVEWLDPLFIGTIGWMREIIEYAGGSVVESLDTDTTQEDKQIDVLVVALCGLSLEKTEQEIRDGRVGKWWNGLRDSQQTRFGKVPTVYLVDGTSMFTRPTRRLLLALEWLVNVLHDPQGEWKTHSQFPYKRIDFEATSNDKATLSPELLEIEELHNAACLKKEAMYKDPKTGYSVLTAYFLKERQECCGNCCRHCPYGHANVKDASRRKNVVVQDVFLKPRGKARRAKSNGDAPGGSIVWPPVFTESSEDQGERDLVVLFWSGGKDSFLSLNHLYASYAAREEKRMPQVVLLTTIDPGTNAVPVQRIDVQTIVAQAEALELPLYLVAVGLGGGYAAKIDDALKQVPAKVNRERITALAFGDLHLEDIRVWREQAFAEKYKLLFPVWKKDYKTELLPELTRLCTQTQATITYSTIDSQELKREGWEVGMPYRWEDVEALNATKSLSVDLMGESGEFHTCVKFPGMK
ncbi:Atp-binding protein, partial [Globisporangium splendens]